MHAGVLRQLREFYLEEADRVVAEGSAQALVIGAGLYVYAELYAPAVIFHEAG